MTDKEIYLKAAELSKLNPKLNTVNLQLFDNHTANQITAVGMLIGYLVGALMERDKILLISKARQKAKRLHKKYYPLWEKDQLAPPPYVLLNGTAMRYRHTHDDYWRDAGVWGVDYTYVRGKLVSNCSHMPELHHQTLTPISRIRWERQNKGYL